MTGKYTLIYADPPWSYRDKAADGERGAGFKYPVMNVLDIAGMAKSLKNAPLSPSDNQGRERAA